METQQMQSEVPQDPVPDLKAERVQEEIVAVAEEPFRIWLKAERVQAPDSLVAPVSSQPGETVSLAYEMLFNQVGVVKVELKEPQIVISLFTTGGLAAA